MKRSAREQKIAARLAEIVRDRRALLNALDRFDGADDFAAVWASEDPDEIKGADRGIDALASDPEDEPGRWRRAALRGSISHAQADRWQAIARGRQRLAHHDADLPPHHGAEIYERAVELLSELPRAVAGIGRWIEALWPPRK